MLYLFFLALFFAHLLISQEYKFQENSDVLFCVADGFISSECRKNRCSICICQIKMR
jgi:hypothetical protein